MLGVYFSVHRSLLDLARSQIPYSIGIESSNREFSIRVIIIHVHFSSLFSSFLHSMDLRLGLGLLFLL